MAFCPNCSAEMPANAVECTSCQYSYPKLLRTSEADSLAYGKLASAALVAGQIAAGIGCLALIIGGIGALLNGRLVEALIGAPITFLLCFANLVVLMRVSEMKPE